MQITEDATTLGRVQADIAAGLERIMAQIERVHAIVGEGGADSTERIALWALETHQAHLHCLQSAVLNRISKADGAMLVLVVDDQPIVLMSAVDCLTSAGFAVLEAEDADQAVEMLEAHPGIDAVFTDVQMRGSMNGLELAREVHRRWPAIKVVVTSGNPGYGAGDVPPGDHFVRKPYVADDIASVLRPAAAPGL